MKNRKPKVSKLTQQKRHLENLRKDCAKADSQKAKAKLTLQILLMEQRIKREEVHRLSGFNRIRGYETASGAPGLGKRG